MADIIFCHFGTFSALLSHETPKNQNFEKMKKKKKKKENARSFHNFTKVYQKS